MDVIGNNLANANTPGFKSSRALFSTLLSQTLRQGSAPTTNLGGTNPVQIGLGTSVSVVDRDLTQGTLDFTARPFDLALMGKGYFAVTDGANTRFTRVGAFGLDAESFMIDVRTGMRALDPQGNAFQVDTESLLEPNATSEVKMAGNLPAVIGGPLPEVLESGVMNTGTQANLNSQGSGPFTGVAGTDYSMSVSVDGAALQTVVIGNPTGVLTAQEVVAAINAQVEGVTAEVSGTGGVSITSDRNGSFSSLQVTPVPDTSNLADLIGMPGNFVTGQDSLANDLTDLSDLSTNLTNYVAGDVITASGVDADGTAIEVPFQYGIDGTTVGDFVTFLGDAFPQSTVTFDPTSGTVQVESNDPGESDMSLVISDSSLNTGSSNWAPVAFGVTSDGTGPDTVSSSIQIYDDAGIEHILNFEFERQDNGTWMITSSMSEDGDQVIDGETFFVGFNPDGSIQGLSGFNLTVQFENNSSSSISVDLGSSGGLDGITQYGSENSLIADSQDGFPPGELSSITVNSNGEVEGFYSNGQAKVLGAFGVARFNNELGLLDLGDGYYGESANSGSVALGEGAQGGVGNVVGGALEQSNVSTADEFVRLIQAQRGYQANARIISIQDRMLEEAVNVV
jgi:flagellar hook protein FlgE